MSLFSSSDKKTQISSSVSALEQPINTQSNAAPVFNIIDNSKSSAYKSRADQNKDINLSITNTDYGAIDAAINTVYAANQDAMLLADSIVDTTSRTMDNISRNNRDSFSDLTRASSENIMDLSNTLSDISRDNSDSNRSFVDAVEGFGGDALFTIEKMGDIYTDTFDVLSETQNKQAQLTADSLSGGVNSVLAFAEKNIQEDKGTTAAILKVLGFTMVGVAGVYAFAKKG